MKTTPTPKLPEALRGLRLARGLSQDDFGEVSGRTYMSALERGLKDPTLGKICQLALVMDVHPLTLLSLAFSGESEGRLRRLLARVEEEAVTALGTMGGRTGVE